MPWNPLRGGADVRLLRGSEVVAVPAGVTQQSVHDCACRWAPDAVRDPDGALLVTDVLQLVGPVPYDERVWRRARMPDGTAAAYAVTDRPVYLPMELTGIDLVAGLARRLGGSYRTGPNAMWDDPRTEPRQPQVYAGRTLPAEEVQRLLAPLLPGLHVAERDDDGYLLESDAIDVSANVEEWSTFPLIRRQPWFTSWEDTTEYAVAFDDETPELVAVAEQVARALRDATGGVLLDDDGFPWAWP